MRSTFTLIIATGWLLAGCSVNSDLRAFRNSVPERISGLAWPELAPLGAFEPLGPLAPAPDARSMAARAAALRSTAASLRARPVLDPARARAMRAALQKYGT